MEESIQIRAAEPIHAARSETSTVDLIQKPPIHHLDSRRPCRVLVVDDDDLVRARLGSLLKAAQYETEIAASGEEALRIMNANPCHIVLTDWQMPDMDGLALCRHVRSAPESGYVYVLMLSVRASVQDQLAGLAAGADDYIVKGASIDEILAHLEVGRRITHAQRSLRSDNRENRRLSITDAVTGAHNLQYLVKQLPRELARARRYGHPLAVLGCTIEELEGIGHRFGADAADDLLRCFVTRCESCIRTSSDWLARMGDNEFMIVLPETRATGAHRVAHKLLQILSMAPVPTRTGPIHFMTSIAVTAVEAKHEANSSSRIEDLIRTAERGMHVRGSAGADSSAADLEARLDALKAGRGGGQKIN